MTYATPVQDMRFTLDHVLNLSALYGSGEEMELSEDLVSAILEEMAKFCDNVIAPLNRVGDTEGAALENGKVRTPTGFREAYGQFVEGGWNGLALSPEFGGQGLPHVLAAVLQDAMHGASMGFTIGTTLTNGGAKALLKIGSDAQKQLYGEKLVSGEWTATMNLTEPGAGSDLAQVATKAEPVGDGTYKIRGQKIFITYGDHDLSDNIIHLVLARLPDAPAGTKGISMFIVPKIHVSDDGALGAHNDVRCIKLEEKLGLHASPTAVMAFGENNDCIGTLLGKEHEGLKNMFLMMNAARLDVGLQGVGIAERAYQEALVYAQERLQGSAHDDRERKLAPIIVHPDVRRMLLAMKSKIEASRAICYATAIASDLEEGGRVSPARAALLTPIAKAWSTDRANEVTSLGVQIHGGMGFIEETGAAQHMRDARIAAIYEGTNGIQAIDLVGRKILADGGEEARALFDEMRVQIKQWVDDGDALSPLLSVALEDLAQTTSWILAQGKGAMGALLAGATPYLELFGNVVGGFYLLRAARAAHGLKQSGDFDPKFLEAKQHIAAFFAHNYLLSSTALAHSIINGADPINEVTPVHLSA